MIRKCIAIEAMSGTPDDPGDTVTVATADYFIVHLFDFIDEGDDVTMPVEQFYTGISYDEAHAVAKREAEKHGLPIELWELE